MPELRQPVVAHLAFPGTQDAGAEATFKGTGNRYSLIPGGVGDELADMTKPSKLGGRALDKLQRAGTPSNRVADLAALELAREIQTYKDEKAYELRTRVESDYGLVRDAR